MLLKSMLRYFLRAFSFLSQFLFNLRLSFPKISYFLYEGNHVGLLKHISSKYSKTSCWATQIGFSNLGFGFFFFNLGPWKR